MQDGLDIRSFCVKLLSELLDPNLHSDEIPTEIISCKDKNGKQYKVQKGWFNALSANLYLIKNVKSIVLSQDTLNQIRNFEEVLSKLSRQDRTNQNNIDEACILIRKILDELTI